EAEQVDIEPLGGRDVGNFHQHVGVVGRAGRRLGLGHRIGAHDQSFLSSPITPASAQSSFGTSWMMTCRFVGLAPACCTMASVMALHSARFCAGERPVHICTVTTGMSLLLR